MEGRGKERTAHTRVTKRWRGDEENVTVGEPRLLQMAQEQMRQKRSPAVLWFHKVPFRQNSFLHLQTGDFQGRRISFLEEDHFKYSSCECTDCFVWASKAMNHKRRQWSHSERTGTQHLLQKTRHQTDQRAAYACKNCTYLYIFSMGVLGRWSSLRGLLDFERTTPKILSKSTNTDDLGV